MAILIGKETKVLVQAITGKSGSLQTKVMLDAGTKIVGRRDSRKRRSGSPWSSCLRLYQ